MEDIDQMLSSQRQEEKSVEFSIGDVIKSIKIYADYIHNQVHTSTFSNESNAIDERQQRMLNTYFALSKAQVKAYNNEPYVAQIYVSSLQEKDYVDFVRKSLTHFILKRTHYPYLKLEVYVLNEQDNARGSSPWQRYEIMKKQSPAIETLKNVFDCEIKY